ncbi:MAG: Calx-beta domain-containing protein [Pseudomonadota bacterium]
MRNFLKKRDGARNRLAQYLIIGLAILPSLSLAATRHVDGEVTSSGDGSSWVEAFKTIQEAIDASATFDEIWVKQGTYVLSSSINVNKWVNIYGGFDGTETVLSQRDWKANVTTVDGNNATRGFYITTHNSTLDGFTITHGKVDGYGAGIYVEKATRPTIINCTFTENSARGYGGAIFNHENSSPTITNCTFIENRAEHGGAIFNHDYSTPTITNCRFFNNHTNSRGGAIYNHISSATISNSLFILNNSYDEGGAIFNYKRSPTISNSTFTLNTGGGGAMYNYYSSPIITNSILWGDSTGEIWNNSSSPTVTYSIVQGGYSGEGNIDADPLFVNDVPGPTLDLHLTAGSPAIDVGNPEAAPDTDFDGNPRPSGKGYDMGAYEYQQPVTLLQFSQADYLVTEDGKTITIKVTRKGDRTGAVSVDYASSDDSATAGSDYTPVSGTLNWANGDTASKKFTVNILDDGEDEDDETLIVSLGNPVGAKLGTPNIGEVTIIDDETISALTVEAPRDGGKLIITAKPSKGWKFKEWAGDCEGNGKKPAKTVVKMNKNQHCAAVFEPK